MTEPTRNEGRHEVRDEPEQWPVLESLTQYRGAVFEVVTETVAMPDGSAARRDVVRRPGAVAALPYDEDTDRVLLLRQYRHPARMALWEPPAGLRDVPGEPATRTAARELYEEAHLRASDWRVLAEMYLSPGMTDEKILIYLARGLADVPTQVRHRGRDEEAILVPAWVPLADAVDGVLAGRLGNPATVAGILALQVAKSTPSGLDGLRRG